MRLRLLLVILSFYGGGYCPAWGQPLRIVRDSATFFYQKGQYDKALLWAQRAEQQALREVGESDTAYVNDIDRIGLIWLAKSDYKTAEPWLQKSLQLRKVAPGTDSLPYARSLTNLGVGTRWQTNNSTARLAHEQALRIRERTLGHEHPLVAECLYNLAVVYYLRVNYAQSLPLYLEALRIQAQTLGKHHPAYAQTLNNLGSQYNMTGEFEKAAWYYEQARQVRADVLGTDHPDYLIGLNNLATTYFAQGNYARSYALLRQVLPKMEKSLGKKHMFYLVTLNGIGMQRNMLGQYDDALQSFAEAAKLADSTVGKQNPLYAITINNAAQVYLAQERYAKAESLFVENNQILLRTIGRKPQYALGLNNLAINCLRQGDTTGVLLMLQQAAQIMVENKAEQVPVYGQILNNQGFVLLKAGQYAAASQLFRQSLAALSTSINRTNPMYLMPVINLAGTLAAQRNYRQADSLYSDALQLRQKHLWANNAGLTEAERNNLSFSTNAIGSQWLSLQHDAPGIANNQLVYEWISQTKSQSLQQMQQLWRSIEQSPDTSLTNRLAQLRAVRERLVFQYQKPLAQQRDVTTLEQQAAELERDLTRRSPVFQQAVKQTGFADVRAALKPGEIAIEFIHFDYQHTRPGDSTLYVAYLVRPEWLQPQRVFLTEEKQLRALLIGDYARDPLVWKKLYKLIWKPLETYMTGAKTIFYSPSGLLHRVAMAALSAPDGRVLADQYELHQLGTTRDVAHRSGSYVYSPALTATLVGGVDYEPAAQGPLVATTRPGTTAAPNLMGLTLVPQMERNGLTGRKLDYLPYTLSEVERIRRLLAPARVHTLTGTRASEDSLKALSGHSPDWLHIATHGYWFAYAKRPVKLEPDGQPAYRWADNPLFRSGLLLAGAGRSWRGEAVPDWQEDGILTAYEVAHLNLSQTKVVVLSACQTGLGATRTIEGVYGLQRAFKLAGVRYVLASLWPVGDAATATFMTLFYEQWRRGVSVDVAFQRAQSTLRKQTALAHKWAGFVLLE